MNEIQTEGSSGDTKDAFEMFPLSSARLGFYDTDFGFLVVVGFFFYFQCF